MKLFFRLPHSKEGLLNSSFIYLSSSFQRSLVKPSFIYLVPKLISILF
jgi:hypothetical protein